MRFLWGDKLGLPGETYLTRWGIEFKRFSIRLHRWTGSDDLRATHDHAWWFWTLVLWGGYLDIAEDKSVDRLRFGSFRFRPAEHRHTVQNNHKVSWTLLVTGAPVRRWAFYVDGKKYMRDKYFAVFGHHRLSGGEPVRVRPDGSLIN